MRRRYRTAFAADPVVRGHPLNRGRVAWWLGLPHQSGGARLFDLLGRYPASCVGGPSWRRSGDFAGLALDGSTQYLSAPCSRPNLGNVTVGVRFIPTPAFTAATWSELIVRQAVAGDEPRGCRILWNSTGYGWFTECKNAYAAHAIDTISAGAEISIAVTIPSLAGSPIRFYRDGRPLVMTVLNSLAGNDSGGMPFWFGGVPNGNPAAALISEAWVYDRILTAPEIAAYQAEMRAGYPNLLRRRPASWAWPGAAFRPWFAPQHAAALGTGVA